MWHLVALSFLPFELKTKHFDLGSVDGLSLTADLDIKVSYDQDSPKFYGQLFHVRFVAKGPSGQIVNEKQVDLGQCFRSPNSLIVEDRFGAGYKQFFISLQYGGISSYLFGFRDRKFYTAYMNNQARIIVQPLPSKNGTWRIKESDNMVHKSLFPDEANGGRTGNMDWMIWRLGPRSRPMLKLASVDQAL